MTGLIVIFFGNFLLKNLGQSYLESSFIDLTWQLLFDNRYDVAMILLLKSYFNNFFFLLL